MLVYGDRSRSARPADLLDAVSASIVESRRAEPRVCRHDNLVAALIEAGMLAQGLADAEMHAACGVDTASPLQAAAMALTTALARAVEASWAGDPVLDGSAVDAALAGLAQHTLPDWVEVKQPEGFAYYALYPEAYAAAARGLPAGTRVIGLRSIGTSLAASVAAGAACEALPLSLRPIGPPFRRHYALADDLWHRLTDRKAPCVALVDEGPGLSGSSLGALADRLEDAGIAPETIVMLPGHGGDLGPQAAPRHRARWRRVGRRLASFEAVVLPRLAAAVDDLTGPILAPLEDLSGGGWRRMLRHDADWPAVDAMQERRKFLLRSTEGTYLLKFVGLGGFGDAALRDASDLHRQGFGPEVLGRRLGFMVSRWEDRSTIQQAPVDRADFLALLAAYLGFRTSLPPDDASRANLAALAEMTAHNVAASLGPQRAEMWRRRYGEIDRLPAPRPVRTDNRLQVWEWIRTEAGLLLKTDGSDHCRAHDLVGCQDIVWDLAGAKVEYDLSTDELDALVTEVDRCSPTPVSRTLLDWTIPAYLAFQTGLWSMAKDRAEVAEQQRIEILLDRYRSGLASYCQPA